MVYRQLPVSISGTLVGSSLLVLTLWGMLPAWLLLGWFALMQANQGWRFLLYRRFRRIEIPTGEHHSWGRYWAVGATISGVLWGIASASFFLPESPIHQLILMITIFAITGTGVALLAPHPASFYGFLLPTVLPMIARNAWEGDALHLLAALIVFVMTLSIIAVNARSRAMIIESLRNRFRNIELVAELQERNKQLESATLLAEQASRAKTQFFAAASHDLRQPLHAMSLFASALSDRVRDPQVLHLVHSINASVDALEALFNELLDISKLDAGVIRPRLEHFPIQRLLDKVALDFEPEAAEKGLRLKVRRARLAVFSDALLLERILRNLVTNALRYTTSGGVLVCCRKRGEHMRIEVWDTGIGIPEDQRERIFEEFYQLANPERSSKKGMGLGLSIVRRLCQLLGHPISVRSKPGSGTVFSLEVPLGRFEAPAIVPEASPATAGMSLKGRTVVVIDDEEPIVAGMRVLLEGWGARVLGGASADEALSGAKIEPGRADLIICDLHLQNNANGFDAIDALRARFGMPTPAILVTGSATPEVAELARSRGLHFLLKPVNPAKLRTLVNFKLQETVTA